MNNVTPIESKSQTPSINVDDYVSRAYMMNPETEVILEGTELKSGMVCILEDSIFREDPKRVAEMSREHESFDYAFERLKKNNRWFKIVRFLSSDRNHRGLTKFIVEFEDGVQVSKVYADTYTWIVRKDSIDAE